jgi:cytochrome c6
LARQGLIAALVFACGPAAAQTPEQVKAGAEIYERNCSPCHGARMMDPQGAADLRKFPHDQHERFVTTVTKGKNQMPPWGTLLKPEEVEALWTYVVNAESLYGH